MTQVFSVPSDWNRVDVQWMFDWIEAEQTANAFGIFPPVLEIICELGDLFL